MCRLFGFHSRLDSGVHRSLIDSENGIIQQSDRHPDGWGMAYYKMQSPHLIKNDSRARVCKIFEKVKGDETSNTVLAHIRKSTIGERSPLNTHPFQYGKWVFAHNGNLKNFTSLATPMKQKIDRELLPYILGDTDSEVLFYLLLSQLKKQPGGLSAKLEGSSFQSALKLWVTEVETIAGPITLSQGDYDQNYLSFVLTDGLSFYSFNGGQGLFFSSSKTRCLERDHCSLFNRFCETKANHGDQVQHLLISSEVIQNENVWLPLPFKSYVGVNSNFEMQLGSIETD